MTRIVTASVALMATAGLVRPVVAQDGPAPDGPGWTGRTNPTAVIAARQALMLELEALMRPIDTYTVDDDMDPRPLPQAARTIAAMLQAVPHLFPPTTNLYDPTAEQPATLALPAIWDAFETFDAMATASETAAATMIEMTDPEALRAASTRLRATCDTCHELYLRPYVPSTVTKEDLEFDFDSIFEEN